MSEQRSVDDIETTEELWDRYRDFSLAGMILLQGRIDRRITSLSREMDRIKEKMAPAEELEQALRRGPKRALVPYRDFLDHHKDFLVLYQRSKVLALLIDYLEDNGRGAYGVPAFRDLSETQQERMQHLAEAERYGDTINVIRRRLELKTLLDSKYEGWRSSLSEAEKKEIKQELNEHYEMVGLSSLTKDLTHLRKMDGG